MSRERLAQEYASGRISRRTFVRRLVAGGVSLGAAISYAHLIGQDKAAAGARAHGDEYGLDDPPAVLIDPVGDPYDGDKSVTLRGRIDTEGRSATYFFRLGRAANPGTWLRSTPQRSLDAGTGKRPVAEAVSGLRPGEEYFVELSAATLTGWRVSEQHRFRAPGGPPVPVVLAPQGTENNDGVVTVRGTVDTGGADTSCYFRIGTASAIGFWQGESPRFELPGTFDGPTTIDWQFTSLAPDLTYYVRIAATTADDWVISDYLSFVNGQPAPPDPADQREPIVVARGISEVLAKVVKSKRLTVGVHANEAAVVKVKAFLVKGGNRVSIGSEKVELTSPYVEQKVKVNLSRAGRRALAGRRRATIVLEASGTDQAGNRGTAEAAFQLS
ncbi:MAG: hypothetical protein M3Y34_00780 [Actinomycetota bacterium]|nr:hypothetical protein [Actinomycetota bacterium]